MPKRVPRPSPQAIEEASEWLWVLLAVEKFGSVGSRADIGRQLEAQGLITLAGDKAELTPLGEKWAKKARNARNR